MSTSHIDCWNASEPPSPNPTPADGTLLFHALPSLLVVAAIGLASRARRLSWPRGSLVQRYRWLTLPGRREEEDAKAYREQTQRHLISQHERYGDIFMQRRAGQPVLFVRSPAGVKAVLMSADFGKVWVTGEAARQPPTVAEYVHNLVQPLLVDPLFSKKGNSNANSDVRTLMSPLFQGSRLFAAGFAAEVEKALDKWPADGHEVDALQLVHDAIRGALYHAIAGSAADALHAIATPSFHQALDHFVARYTQPGHEQRMTAADEEIMTTLHAAAIRVVGSLRARRAAPAGACAMPSDALAAIMLDGGYSDEDCAAVIVNVVIAGAEAPASSLAHTLRELARQPELQEQLRAEVHAAGWAGALVATAHADKGAAAEATTAADEPRDGGVLAALAAMPLGKACVIEGLRVFAPATLVKRQALCDTLVDGVFVPRGTVVELCITAAHQDPKQFEAPLAFNPHRANKGVIGSERAYMPFSGGRRGCPGRPLALTMERVALAAVIHRFRLAPAEGAERPREMAEAAEEDERVRKFILWPAKGVLIRVHQA